MVKIKGEFSWCEYLTPCPYGKDCMVGDFECCCSCEHHNKVEILQSLKGGYSDSIGALEVECNKE